MTKQSYNKLLCNQWECDTFAQIDKHEVYIANY